MRKLSNHRIYLSTFISIALLFLLLSCAWNTTGRVSEKEKWQLFAEIGQGKRQLWVNTASVLRLGDGVFKCPAKIIPSPQRIEALKNMITKGNEEAGVEESKGKLFLEAMIKHETSVHDSEIGCKQNMFYLWKTKQEIITYTVSESGPDREVLKTVCESE